MKKAILAGVCVAISLTGCGTVIGRPSTKQVEDGLVKIMAANAKQKGQTADEAKSRKQAQCIAPKLTASKMNDETLQAIAKGSQASYTDATLTHRGDRDIYQQAAKSCAAA